MFSFVDWQAEVAESKMKPIGTKCRDDKVDTGKKICSSFSSDKDEMPTGDRALVPFHMKTRYPEKAEFALATEENKFSQTALEVLYRKREKLVIYFLSATCKHVIFCTCGFYGLHLP